MDPTPGLTLRAERAGVDMLVTATGHLDESCTRSITALADHPLNTNRRIVLDLAGVTYLDSDGVYALVALQQRASGFQLRNPTPAVAVVLQLTALDVWLRPLPPAP
jgi:anti-anti-sigma factor